MTEQQNISPAPRKPWGTPVKAPRYEVSVAGNSYTFSRWRDALATYHSERRLALEADCVCGDGWPVLEVDGLSVRHDDLVDGIGRRSDRPAPRRITDDEYWRSRGEAFWPRAQVIEGSDL